MKLVKKDSVINDDTAIKIEGYNKTYEAIYYNNSSVDFDGSIYKGYALKIKNKDESAENYTEIIPKTELDFSDWYGVVFLFYKKTSQSTETLGNLVYISNLIVVEDNNGLEYTINRKLWFKDGLPIFSKITPTSLKNKEKYISSLYLKNNITSNNLEGYQNINGIYNLTIDTSKVAQISTPSSFFLLVNFLSRTIDYKDKDNYHIYLFDSVDSILKVSSLEDNQCHYIYNNFSVTISSTVLELSKFKLRLYFYQNDDVNFYFNYDAKKVYSIIKSDINKIRIGLANISLTEGEEIESPIKVFKNIIITDVSPEYNSLSNTITFSGINCLPKNLSIKKVNKTKTNEIPLNCSGLVGNKAECQLDKDIENGIYYVFFGFDNITNITIDTLVDNKDYEINIPEEIIEGENEVTIIPNLTSGNRDLTEIIRIEVKEEGMKNFITYDKNNFTLTSESNGPIIKFKINTSKGIKYIIKQIVRKAEEQNDSEEILVYNDNTYVLWILFIINNKYNFILEDEEPVVKLEFFKSLEADTYKDKVYMLKFPFNSNTEESLKCNYTSNTLICSLSQAEPNKIKIRVDSASQIIYFLKSSGPYRVCNIYLPNSESNVNYQINYASIPSTMHLYGELRDSSSRVFSSKSEDFPSNSTISSFNISLSIKNLQVDKYLFYASVGDAGDSSKSKQKASSITYTVYPSLTIDTINPRAILIPSGAETREVTIVFYENYNSGTLTRIDLKGKDNETKFQLIPNIDNKDGTEQKFTLKSITGTNSIEKEYTLFLVYNNTCVETENPSNTSRTIFIYKNNLIDVSPNYYRKNSKEISPITFTFENNIDKGSQIYFGDIEKKVPSNIVSNSKSITVDPQELDNTIEVGYYQVGLFFTEGYDELYDSQFLYYENEIQFSPDSLTILEGTSLESFSIELLNTIFLQQIISIGYTTPTQNTIIPLETYSLSENKKQIELKTAITSVSVGDYVFSLKDIKETQHIFTFIVVKKVLIKEAYFKITIKNPAKVGNNLISITATNYNVSEITSVVFRKVNMSNESISSNITFEKDSTSPDLKLNLEQTDSKVMAIIANIKIDEKDLYNYKYILITISQDQNNKIDYFGGEYVLQPFELKTKFIMIDSKEGIKQATITIDLFENDTTNIKPSCSLENNPSNTCKTNCNKMIGTELNCTLNFSDNVTTFDDINFKMSSNDELPKKIHIITGEIISDQCQLTSQKSDVYIKIGFQTDPGSFTVHANDDKTAILFDIQEEKENEKTFRIPAKNLINISDKAEIKIKINDNTYNSSKLTIQYFDIQMINSQGQLFLLGGLQEMNFEFDKDFSDTISSVELEKGQIVYTSDSCKKTGKILTCFFNLSSTSGVSNLEGGTYTVYFKLSECQNRFLSQFKVLINDPPIIIKNIFPSFFKRDSTNSNLNQILTVTYTNELLKRQFPITYSINTTVPKDNSVTPTNPESETSSTFTFNIDKSISEGYYNIKLNHPNVLESDVTNNDNTIFVYNNDLELVSDSITKFSDENLSSIKLELKNEINPEQIEEVFYINNTNKDLPNRTSLDYSLSGKFISIINNTEFGAEDREDAITVKDFRNKENILKIFVINKTNFKEVELDITIPKPCVEEKENVVIIKATSYILTYVTKVLFSCDGNQGENKENEILSTQKNFSLTNEKEIRLEVYLPKGYNCSLISITEQITEEQNKVFEKGLYVLRGYYVEQTFFLVSKNNPTISISINFYQEDIAQSNSNQILINDTKVNCHVNGQNAICPYSVTIDPLENLVLNIKDSYTIIRLGSYTIEENCQVIGRDNAPVILRISTSSDLDNELTVRYMKKSFSKNPSENPKEYVFNLTFNYTSPSNETIFLNYGELSFEVPDTEVYIYKENKIISLGTKIEFYEPNAEKDIDFDFESAGFSKESLPTFILVKEDEQKIKEIRLYDCDIGSVVNEQQTRIICKVLLSTEDKPGKYNIIGENQCGGKIDMGNKFQINFVDAPNILRTISPNFYKLQNEDYNFTVTYMEFLNEATTPNQINLVFPQISPTSNIPTKLNDTSSDTNIKKKTLKFSVKHSEVSKENIYYIFSNYNDKRNETSDVFVLFYEDDFELESTSGSSKTLPEQNKLRIKASRDIYKEEIKYITISSSNLQTKNIDFEVEVGTNPQKGSNIILDLPSNIPYGIYTFDLYKAYDGGNSLRYTYNYFENTENSWFSLSKELYFFKNENIESQITITISFVNEIMADYAVNEKKLEIKSQNTNATKLDSCIVTSEKNVVNCTYLASSGESNTQYTISYEGVNNLNAFFYRYQLRSNTCAPSSLSIDITPKNDSIKFFLVSNISGEYESTGSDLLSGITNDGIYTLYAGVNSESKVNVGDENITFLTEKNPSISKTDFMANEENQDFQLTFSPAVGENIKITHVVLEKTPDETYEIECAFKEQTNLECIFNESIPVGDYSLSYKLECGTRLGKISVTVREREDIEVSIDNCIIKIFPFEFSFEGKTLDEENYSAKFESSENETYDFTCNPPVTLNNLKSVSCSIKESNLPTGKSFTLKIFKGSSELLREIPDIKFTDVVTSPSVIVGRAFEINATSCELPRTEIKLEGDIISNCEPITGAQKLECPIQSTVSNYGEKKILFRNIESDKTIFISKTLGEASFSFNKESLEIGENNVSLSSSDYYVRGIKKITLTNTKTEVIDYDLTHPEGNGSPYFTIKGELGVNYTLTKVDDNEINSHPNISGPVSSLKSTLITSVLFLELNELGQKREVNISATNEDEIIEENIEASFNETKVSCSKKGNLFSCDYQAITPGTVDVKVEGNRAGYLDVIVYYLDKDCLVLPTEVSGSVNLNVLPIDLTDSIKVTKGNTIFSNINGTYSIEGINKEEEIIIKHKNNTEQKINVNRYTKISFIIEDINDKNLKHYSEASILQIKFNNETFEDNNSFVLKGKDELIFETFNYNLDRNSKQLNVLFNLSEADQGEYNLSYVNPCGEAQLVGKVKVYSDIEFNYIEPQSFKLSGATKKVTQVQLLSILGEEMSSLYSSTESPFLISNIPFGQYRVRITLNNKNFIHENILKILEKNKNFQLESDNKTISANSTLPWITLTFNQPITDGSITNVTMNNVELPFKIGGENQPNDIIVNTKNTIFSQDMILNVGTDASISKFTIIAKKAPFEVSRYLYKLNSTENKIINSNDINYKYFMKIGTKLIPIGSGYYNTSNEELGYLVYTQDQKDYYEHYHPFIFTNNFKNYFDFTYEQCIVTVSPLIIKITEKEELNVDVSKELEVSVDGKRINEENGVYNVSCNGKSALKLSIQIAKVTSTSISIIDKEIACVSFPKLNINSTIQGNGKGNFTLPLPSNCAILNNLSFSERGKKFSCINSLCEYEVNNIENYGENDLYYDGKKIEDVTIKIYKLLKDSIITVSYPEIPSKNNYLVTLFSNEINWNEIEIEENFEKIAKTKNSTTLKAKNHTNSIILKIGPSDSVTINLEFVEDNCLFIVQSFLYWTEENKNFKVVTDEIISSATYDLSSLQDTIDTKDNFLQFIDPPQIIGIKRKVKFNGINDSCNNLLVLRKKFSSGWEWNIAEYNIISGTFLLAFTLNEYQEIYDEYISNKIITVNVFSLELGTQLSCSYSRLSTTEIKVSCLNLREGDTVSVSFYNEDNENIKTIGAIPVTNACSEGQFNYNSICVDSCTDLNLLKQGNECVKECKNNSGKSSASSKQCTSRDSMYLVDGIWVNKCPPITDIDGKKCIISENITNEEEEEYKSAFESLLSSLNLGDSYTDGKSITPSNINLDSVTVQSNILQLINLISNDHANVTEEDSLKFDTKYNLISEGKKDSSYESYGNLLLLKLAIKVNQIKNRAESSRRILSEPNNEDKNEINEIIDSYIKVIQRNYTDKEGYILVDKEVNPFLKYHLVSNNGDSINQYKNNSSGYRYIFADISTLNKTISKYIVFEGQMGKIYPFKNFTDSTKGVIVSILDNGIWKVLNNTCSTDAKIISFVKSNGDVEYISDCSSQNKCHGTDEKSRCLTEIEETKFCKTNISDSQGNIGKVRKLPLECIGKIGNISKNIAFWLYLVIAILSISGLVIARIFKEKFFQIALENDNLRLGESIDKFKNTQDLYYNRANTDVKQTNTDLNNVQIDVPPSFMDSFKENILSLHPIIDLFTLSLIDPIYIKIPMLSFSLFSYFTFNAIYYTNDMLKDWENDGKGDNFGYPMKTEFEKIMSAICTTWLLIGFLKFCFLIVQEKFNKIKNKLQSIYSTNYPVKEEFSLNTRENIGTLFLIFRISATIVYFALWMFFWVYAIGYCGVFKNVQYSWFYSCIWTLFWVWLIFCPLYITLISLVESKMGRNHASTYYMKALFFL